MNYDSLIRIINNEPPTGRTYRFAFNSQRWTLKPGQQNYLPFDAVIRSMGDPRSAPEPTKVIGQGGRSTIIPSRTQELQRLSVLYGVYGETIDSVDGDSGKTLLDMIPNVTGFNMEDSEEITFPYMDPTCSNQEPDADDISQTAILFREMEKMRRQMMVYEEILKQNNPQFAADADSSGAEVDEDTPSPVRRPTSQTSQPPRVASKTA